MEGEKEDLSKVKYTYYCHHGLDEGSSQAIDPGKRIIN